jgi:hypothetical protein
LNVKSFLAGKRGVCPQCGAGLDIPLESQISKDADKGKATTQSPGVTSASAMSVPISSPSSPSYNIETSDNREPETPAAAAMPMGTPVVPTSPSPLARTPGASGGAAAPSPRPLAVPMQPVVPTQPAAPVQPMAPVQAARVDPIDEAPEAIWYVRPPSGGQYGPARGDIMRKWMGEGRVSPDSLVWREGWDDWHTASDVFLSLGSAVTPPMPAPVAPAAYSASPTPSHSSLSHRPRRRNSTALAITVVTVLGLMCVALFVALIFILMR